MAKKAKKTTKAKAQRRYSLADDHSFLIVVGGGFIIILLMLITLSRSSVMNRLNADDAPTVSSEVVDKNTITISDDSLAPESLTVPVGTQVTWVNADEDSHMVTSYNGTFDSKELKTGEKSSYMFTTAGTYTYTVDDMSGSIVVE